MCQILLSAMVMAAFPSEVTEGGGPQWRAQEAARRRLVVISLVSWWHSRWGRWPRLEACGYRVPLLSGTLSTAGHLGRWDMGHEGYGREAGWESKLAVLLSLVEDSGSV